MATNHDPTEAVQPDLDVEPRFYTLDQTALYLNVSRPQVYSLVRSGELPAIKLGGRGVWRVDRHQLEVYLERLLEETREWAKAHPLARAAEPTREDEEPEDEFNQTVDGERQ